MDQTKYSYYIDVKEENEDRFPGDSKNPLRWKPSIILPQQEDNIFSISPDITAKIKSEPDPIKLELDASIGKDISVSSLFENDLPNNVNGIPSIPGLINICLKQEAGSDFQHEASDDIQVMRDISKKKSYQKIYSGEKPFKCDKCRKNFSNNTNLSKHQRIHTGEKPFKCDMCMKRFSRSFDLHKHQRIHTKGKPFKCDICMKQFRQTSYLTIHRRIHTGEKPFKCQVCEKCFISSPELSKHQRIHSGEKPYQCDICMKKFTRSSSSTVHQRTHTKEEHP